MSDYTAIRAVSQTLLALLQNNITNSSSPDLAGVTVDLRTPKEMQEAQNAEGISLWLYRVMRNGDLVNQPPARPSPNQVARQPLPIDLYYLVTPIRRDPAAEQTLMGRVLQVFYDHSILAGSALRDSLAGSSAELRLTLETLSLEEITRVWTA